MRFQPASHRGLGLPRGRQSARIRPTGRAAVIAVLGTVAFLLPVPSSASPGSLAGISGRTYFVSSSGSDSNSGLSPDQAWRSVDQVNRAHLRPGDGVLFQGGQAFSDDTLMPGWGTDASGTTGAPIVFGSYGQGRASLPQGIWTKNESNLVFQSLNLGPQQGLSGTGQNITLQDCSIKNILDNGSEIAVNTNGSNYTIRDNVIDGTGDSGMLLLGDHYLVQNNTISNTGLDRGITYGAHGIYLKAPDSVVISNIITNFQNQGISVRYRNSTVTHNFIDGGEIGIGWHQYDTLTGTSHWLDNTIVNTTSVGIYISPHDIGGSTHENFVITGNTLIKPSHQKDWQAMNLDTNSTVHQSQTGSG
jgi:hypothetical protein